MSHAMFQRERPHPSKFYRSFRARNLFAVVVMGGKATANENKRRHIGNSHRGIGRRSGSRRVGGARLPHGDEDPPLRQRKGRVAVDIQVRDGGCFFGDAAGSRVSKLTSSSHFPLPQFNFPANGYISRRGAERQSFKRLQRYIGRRVISPIG